MGNIVIFGPGRPVKWLLCLAALIGVGLTACGKIDSPEDEGALRVAAFPDPARSHLPDGTLREGFVPEFMGRFARQLGVPVSLREVENFEELELLVREGRVHVGAFLNTMPPPPGIVFSKVISSTPLWVVGHSDSIVPHSLADLAGRDVHTIPGSPAAAALDALPVGSRPSIIGMPGRNQQDLLELVAQRQIELAAVDELHMRVATSFQPDLQPAVKLFGERKFALAFPETMDRNLRERLEAFIDEGLADGSLLRLYDSYYGHIQRINPESAARFLSDVRTLLPKYRHLFHRAQERTGLDWRLIAALAYQESHWDPQATSFTNVRGMMMLTEDTADMLRVDNRLDPAQSIRGGADYLLYLMEQLPASIEMPDRVWLALAAYNLGMGHLNGGRAIAKSLNKNPDVWYELKSVLPLLMRPEYYERLKSGRARGGEAVILVENVRNLQDILSRLEPAHVPPLAREREAAPAGAKIALGSGLRQTGQATGLSAARPPR